MEVFSIGHSTRSIKDFIDLLKMYEIEIVIDVRRFPKSKKFPHFNKNVLENFLREVGIEYLHFEKLGGFRKEGYENFSKTKEFENSVNEIIKISKNKRAAIMCAEVFWFKCHRRYISESLARRGIKVFHILNKEKIFEHRINDEYIKRKMEKRIRC